MDRLDQTSTASDDDDDTSDPLRQGKKKNDSYEKQQTDGYTKHNRLLEMSVAQGYRLSYKLNIGRSFIHHVGGKRLFLVKRKKKYWAETEHIILMMPTVFPGDING